MPVWLLLIYFKTSALVAVCRDARCDGRHLVELTKQPDYANGEWHLLRGVRPHDVRMN